MKSRKLSLTIFACLLEKSVQALERFYSKDAIVATLFRALDLDCQTIILKTLSVSQKNLFLEQKRLNKAMETLRALKLVDVVEERYVLNTTFKTAFSRVISHGPKPLFEQCDRSVEEAGSDSKWTQVYAYILKNVSGQTPKHLTREAVDVLDTEGLVINMDDTGEGQRQQKSFGFSFLVRPLSNQVNLFMWYLTQYLLRHNFRAKGEKFDESELIELLCALSLLHPGYLYSPRTRLPAALLSTVFTTLESVGFLSYNAKQGTVKVTDLLHRFLDPAKAEVESYKTNIIVENDFRLYAYSSMDYLKYFLSKINRPFHGYQDPVPQSHYCGHQRQKDEHGFQEGNQLRPDTQLPAEEHTSLGACSKAQRIAAEEPSHDRA